MARRKKSTLAWLIGGGIVAVALSALYFISMPDTLVYFYTPDEVIEKAPTLGQKTLRVGGMVKAGSVQDQRALPLLSFVLWDMRGHELKVSYQGIPPDMFKENQGVVVEGRLSGADSMVAKKLLVKHSEEYKKPDQKHSMDKALLEQSLFKE